MAVSLAGIAQTPSPAGSPGTSPDTTPSPSAVATSGTDKVVPSLENAAPKKLDQGKNDSGTKRIDSVFSALVLATKSETPSQPTAELGPLVPKLKSIFGYNQFELVGSHTELMDNPDERWLVPSKLFSLSIKSKREKNASYLLNLQLFQESKMLTGFDAKLGTESPIFIRGPQYGQGQLVIVLILK